MTEKTATISQAAAPPPPGHYHLESGRGTIRASARAMFGLITVKGTFRIRDGEVCIADDPAACTARATIDASSYDSGNARRDRDVSSPALLDAGRFPDITFTGTGARAEHDSWVVDGSVSAHGATDTIQVRVSEARADGDGAYFLASGFGMIEHVSQRDAVPAALWDRSDSLRPVELSRLAHATVTGK